jgi:hypothetical protein
VAREFLERIHVRTTDPGLEVFVRHAIGAAGFDIAALPPALVAARLKPTA